MNIVKLSKFNKCFCILPGSAKKPCIEYSTLCSYFPAFQFSLT